MNERIKELAKQVDVWFEEDGHSYSRHAWNEKFAELIVRECHNYFYDDSVPFNGVDGLLAHFGVEQ